MEKLIQILNAYILILKEEGDAKIKYALEEDDYIMLRFSFSNEISNYDFLTKIPYDEKISEAVFAAVTAVNTIKELNKIPPIESLIFDMNKIVFLPSKDMIFVAQKLLNNLYDLLVS